MRYFNNYDIRRGGVAIAPRRRFHVSGISPNILKNISVRLSLGYKVGGSSYWHKHGGPEWLMYYNVPATLYAVVLTEFSFLFRFDYSTVQYVL